MNTIFKFLHSIMVTLTLQISKLTKAVVLKSFQHGRFWQFAGADPERGAPGACPPPPKIGKNMVFLRKIVTFHTKYPKHFRASLRNWKQ